MDSGVFLGYHCRVVLCSLKTRAIQIKPHSITHWTVWSDLGWGFWTPWFYSSLLLHACFVWLLFNNLCTLTASLIPLCSAPSSPSPACLQQLCSSGNQSLRKFYFPLHARIVRSVFLEVSLTDMVSSHCYSHTMDLLKSYGYCAMWS